MNTRTPLPKVPKIPSVHPEFSGSNPFDSDSEPELNSRPARASSAPPINQANVKSQQYSYDEDEGRWASSVSYMGSSTARNRDNNGFHKSGSLQNLSLQELENYAVDKAEETTEKVRSCLKIAEEIREDATRTLVKLHQQGEQTDRTHLTAVTIDHDLSRGEKLLGSLGGIFSKTWRPKKNHPIKGPLLKRDDSFLRRGNHLEQRQRLGLWSPTTSRPNLRELPSEPLSTLEKVEFEKAKQDDDLSDLSNLLGQLKEMAVDMGSEIGRQNTALDHMHDDVDELSFRVKGANQRARRLLGR